MPKPAQFADRLKLEKIFGMVPCVPCQLDMCKFVVLVNSIPCRSSSKLLRDKQTGFVPLVAKGSKDSNDPAKMMQAMMTTMMPMMQTMLRNVENPGEVTFFNLGKRKAPLGDASRPSPAKKKADAHPRGGGALR